MPSRRVLTATPVQLVSSFVHLVTQWMSLVTVSVGSFRNSSQLQVVSASTAPVIVKLHSASGVCGVGRAEISERESSPSHSALRTRRSAPLRLQAIGGVSITRYFLPQPDTARLKPCRLRHFCERGRNARGRVR